MTTAFPLKWPDGWPRTPASKQSTGDQFKGGSTYESDGQGGSHYVGRKLVTLDRARQLLSAELARIEARNVVLSTNLPLRLDGHPRADAARLRMDDPGVAVYFTLKGKQMVMATDAFQTIAANMRSLGLAIEAMRQLHRHGGGAMMERAFSGFAALPPPRRSWREVMHIRDDADVDADVVEATFRALAKKRHPDAGGSQEGMAELLQARDAALRELGA